MIQSLFTRNYLNSNYSAISKPKVAKDASVEDVSAISQKKNTSSLPDDVVESIQKMAREDASKGVYMDDEFISYNKQYMQSHVSPNRTNLISILTPMLNRAKYTNGLPNLFQLPDLFYTGTLQVGALTGASMSICDKSGTEILSYDNNNGWLSHPTKQENQYQSETTAVYHEAYAAARAEMKADASAGLDMKV